VAAAGVVRRATMPQVDSITPRPDGAGHANGDGKAGDPLGGTTKKDREGLLRLFEDFVAHLDEVEEPPGPAPALPSPGTLLRASPLSRAWSWLWDFADRLGPEFSVIVGRRMGCPCERCDPEFAAMLRREREEAEAAQRERACQPVAAPLVKGAVPYRQRQRRK
jgi:hypothetical protein